jgi:hypothetical protein
VTDNASRKPTIKSALLGALVFLASFPLLWWNEARAVIAAEAMPDASVVEAASDSVSASNDGKLVHVSGAALAVEPLRDSVFAVSEKALRLVRVVEMFQWVEIEKTDTSGGATSTTYTYEKKWSERLVDSSTFKTRADHDNPTTMPYSGLDMLATDAKLGAYALSEGALKRLTKLDDLPVSDAARESLAPELKAKTQVFEGRFYLAKTPSQPTIGDARVGFRVVKPQIVSVVAQQIGGTLGAMPAKTGDGVLRVEPGAVEAEKMFAPTGGPSDVLTWIVRGLGFVLMAFGLSLALRPIAATASFVPKIGRFVGVSAVVFSVVVSMGLSGVTIAIAWIAHRPLIGIAVLLGGAGTLAIAVLMARTARRKRATI